MATPDAYTSPVPSSPYDDVTLFPVAPSQDVDDYYYFYKRLYTLKKEYFLVIRIAICILGSVGNVVNIWTFLKMGLVDSVTIVFLNLAVADFFLVIVSLIPVIATTLEYLPQETLLSFKVHPWVLKELCTNILNYIFTYAEILITTFLAVQRCLCVIRPLQFSDMFTKPKTYVVLLIIWGFSLGMNLAVLNYFYLPEERVPFNRTWITVGYTSDYGDYTDFLSLAENVLFSLCQVVVVVSLVVIAKALAKSVRFRQKSSHINTSSLSPPKAGSSSLDLDKKHKVKDENKNSLSGHTLSNSKERRVIIQVGLVAAIFVMTHFQGLIIQLIRQLPQVQSYFRQNNRYFYYRESSQLLKLMNASVNVFIYYKYNTRFRQLCFKRKNNQKS